MIAATAGLTTGAVTGNKNTAIAAGGLTLIALLVLYYYGKEDRAKVESELAQQPSEEQEYWEPALDDPKIIPFKIQERFTA